MEATPEAEWPDEFTREEMLEQQSRLLIEELRLLQDEVSRQRKNIAKLVDMNGEATKEREAARADLAKAKETITRLNTESCEQSREVRTLKAQLNQHKAVMREHKIPGYYFEPNCGDPIPIKVVP
ncbi:hypothetical protein [Pseudomonas abietaniphila]|uniref:Uncharacterized protein n=1 Tax=Pseudomonas abietaniphila TaxID=89065 RepID=A0A1G8LHU9_9PSED|nr:hypothetical protein [Pseudomonas abietaniphila]SDI54790.1 hypothetical protein SAMN05216605_114138 [Pseudomonas abietaniphila]